MDDINNEFVRKFESQLRGLINIIKFDQLKAICRYFEIELTQENFGYCVSIQATYEGFLTQLYTMEDRGENIADPEGEAYKLTALALGLFRKNKLPPTVLKLSRMAKKKEVQLKK